MNARRIKTVVRRHVYVLKRSPHRFFDVTVWPLLDVLLFGSLGAYVAQQDGASKAGAPYLLAGILMFHVLYQLQIAICTGFMEETWSRNVLNILTTPVTEAEYILGVALFGLAKLVIALVALSVMAIAFFGFNLASVGWGLVPITAVLLLAGWSIGMAVIGLMLRYGQSAEILAWGINFLVMALSGVFNPVDAIPGLLQPVSRILPTTHAFSALRRHALDRLFVAVPRHDLVVVLHEAQAHVGAHASQPDHADLHLDLLEVVDFDAQDSPAVRLEALEVADGLGVDQRLEVVGLPGDLDVGGRCARCDLHGDHLVRTALVELARGVQKARPVAGGDRHATEPVAHGSAKALEVVVLSEGQVGLQGDVVAVADRALQPVRNRRRIG